MVVPILLIDGKRVAPGRVWVHLQRVATAKFALYHLYIPAQLLAEIVSPCKPPSQSWASYIWAEVTDLGSFAVEGFILNTAKRCNQTSGAYEWVLATVDEVLEEEAEICIIGKALRFDHNLGVPELKLLE